MSAVPSVLVYMYVYHLPVPYRWLQGHLWKWDPRPWTPFLVLWGEPPPVLPLTFNLASPTPPLSSNVVTPGGTTLTPFTSQGQRKAKVLAKNRKEDKTGHCTVAVQYSCAEMYIKCEVYVVVFFLYLLSLLYALIPLCPQILIHPSQNCSHHDQHLVLFCGAY